MARELVRVMSDSFEAVLLSWRGRKLLSRQLSPLLMLLACSFSIVKPGAKVITIEPFWNRILLSRQRILQLSRQLSRLKGRLLCLGCDF